jgi:hypothetical protein
VKLSSIILEAEFFTYEAMVQVIHSDNIGSDKLASLMRALPGVTTVTTAGQDESRNLAIYKIKLISQKPAKEAFTAMRKNALSKYSDVKVVKVGEYTIEKK